MKFADLSKQRAEGEATLAKERAESATREVKRLELMVPSTCYTSNFLFSIFYLYVHYLCRFICSLKNHIFMCRICLDFCSSVHSCLILVVSLLQSVKKEIS
jgi:hypothetical protein